MALKLERVFLDWLDGAGDESFDAWLTAEREDARMARAAVLRLLATHQEASALSAQKWMRLWYDEDPQGAEAHERAQRAEAASSIEAVMRVEPLVGARPVAQAGSAETEPRARRIAHARANALRAQRIGFCQVRDGTKIAYATIGSGPPIVKAANWLNHLEFDWASPIWGKSFAELARAHTFVRYDERGCGLSDWEVKDLSFDPFVEDLEVVADALDLDRFPLVGISQGAAVSIEYAVRHPERVSGLILLGGYAAGWRHIASPEEQEQRKAVMTLTQHGWGTANPAYRHIFSQTFMPEASPGELAWFDEFQRQNTSPANAARFQEAFGHIDVRNWLAEVTTPTIVLHSRHDQRIPMEQGRALASGIAGAQFVPLDSRNHILLDHEPAWLDGMQAISQFLLEIRA